MKRRSVLLFIDLFLIALSAIGALILRDNLVLDLGHIQSLLPYLMITLGVSVSVLVALGLHRSIWRLSAMKDYVSVITATLVIVILSVGLGFIVNRLDGVARSLPILQGVLMVFTLVGVRVMTRQRHALKIRKTNSLTSSLETPEAREIVLVAGINRIAELYLESVAEFAADSITIAGVLGRSDRHSGRLVQRQKVWGRVDEIARLLPEIEASGFFVQRIIVTRAVDRLSTEARDALHEIEQTTDIKVDYWGDRLRLDVVAREIEQPASDTASHRHSEFSITSVQAAILKQRNYRHIKRLFDATAALCLLVITAPLLLAVAVLVALDLGPSAMEFRQQRPGAGGRPFQLYKFGTMSSSRDADDNFIPDEQRVSAIGRFVRRFRLDELPQLINILIGDMSFVGPRPLLHRDQAVAHAARLLVRPGLTGWAQIMGGREVADSDKAALDVWYILNASLMLDFKISLRTVPMVILGERTNAAMIQQTWLELEKSGIVSGMRNNTADRGDRECDKTKNQHSFDTKPVSFGQTCPGGIGQSRLHR